MQADVIFAGALKLASRKERIAYVEACCAGRPDLARKIISRLDEQATDAREETPRESTAGGDEQNDGFVVNQTTVPRDLPIGAILGGQYKLLQKLGQGGMGEIYAADQLHPIRRRVALKVIRGGLDASSSILARFEQERQALALMDHPNIARIYDAGVTEENRPYFVMELVKGLPLTKFCDEEKLSVRDRLQLFVPICQAVQHAHQKGIIHRDLKPSNILVGFLDGKPVPKVIDFGVAKALNKSLTEQTVYTDLRSIVGTYEYMAPEQARMNNLDIDTRADIYSLGVILFELLTGELPFSREQLRTAPFDEMLRMIREAEPPKPSTKLSHSTDLSKAAAQRREEPRRLTRQLQSDLDWIVLKCLEKERNGRYETANGLALEIQRYLRDEPILAGPPGAGYRIKKFLKKHRGKVAVAAAGLLLLVAGVVGTTIGMLKAKAAERMAETEAAIARTMNDFLLNDLLGMADVSRQLGSGIKPDSEIKLKTLLSKASQQLLAGRVSAPAAAQANLHHTMGLAFYALSQYDLAREHLQQAVKLREVELGRQHPLRLASLFELSRVLHEQNKYSEADLLLREVDQAFEEIPVITAEQKLQVKFWIALNWLELRRFDDADRLLESLQEQVKEQLSPQHPLLGMVLRCRGDTRAAQRDFAAAQPYYQQAMTLQRKSPLSPDPALLITMNNQAICLRSQRQYEAAEMIYREILQLAAPLFQPDHLFVLKTRGNLAAALLFQRQQAAKLEESGTILREILPISLNKYGADHEDVLAFKNTLAVWCEITKDLREAERLNVELLDAFHRNPSAHASKVLPTTLRVARVCEQMPNPAMARRHFEAAYHLMSKESKANVADFFAAAVGTANACLAMKDYPAAKDFLTKAEGMVHSPGIEKWHIARMYRLYGEVLQALQQDSAGREKYQKSKKLFEEDKAAAEDKYLSDSPRKKELDNLNRLLSDQGNQ